MIKRVYILILCSLLCVSCSDRSKSFSGYIEGDYTYISSSLSGTLMKLNVTRGQQVNIGDTLFILDQQPEYDMMTSAKATVAQNKANLALAEIQLKRQQILYAKNATDKSTLDQTKTDFQMKWQLVQAAYSNLYQTQWSLQQKTVNAPVSGQVFDTFFRVGEKVPANNPVLALLTPYNIRVVFFIPEKILSQIKIGQTLTFSCDSCKQKTTATINYISPQAEYTPPIIYSKDTREKLVYLVRADIPVEIANEFHPGQPIDVFLQN